MRFKNPSRNFSFRIQSAVFFQKLPYFLRLPRFMPGSIGRAPAGPVRSSPQGKNQDQCQALSFVYLPVSLLLKAVCFCAFGLGTVLNSMRKPRRNAYRQGLRIIIYSVDCCVVRLSFLHLPLFAPIFLSQRPRQTSCQRVRRTQLSPSIHR